MDCTRAGHRWRGWLWLLAVAAASSGCETVHTPEKKSAASNTPSELNKTTMPDYVVEPPDLIVVEVLEALPGRPITGERLPRARRPLPPGLLRKGERP